MRKPAPASLRRYTDKIEDVYTDPEGNYWVDLKNGWFCTDTETHSITESTLRLCAIKLQSVIPCQCEDCTRGGDARA